MTQFLIGNDYVEGMCRNFQHRIRSHLYKTEGDKLWPMCGYGWNRSDGEAFSIFRGHQSKRGTCKLCLKNMDLKKEPFRNGWKHKTRWL